VVWLVSKAVGVATPHLRETPKALWSYIRSYLGVLFITLLIFIVAFAVVMALLRLSGSSPRGYQIVILCVIPASYYLGSYLFFRLSYRTFLWTPMLSGDRETLRGEELECKDEITERAWSDE
jgi:hypothetical protein